MAGWALTAQLVPVPLSSPLCVSTVLHLCGKYIFHSTYLLLVLWLVPMYQIHINGLVMLGTCWVGKELGLTPLKMSSLPLLEVCTPWWYEHTCIYNPQQTDWHHGWKEMETDQSLADEDARDTGESVRRCAEKYRDQGHTKGRRMHLRFFIPTGWV